MADTKELQKVLEQETVGRTVYLTRETDILNRSYTLSAESQGKLLQSHLHPDDPLPFADHEWDSVVIANILGDIPDPSALIQEAYRIARQRLLIVQQRDSWRSIIRLTEIVQRYFLFFDLLHAEANGIVFSVFVIPSTDDPVTMVEFTRRRGKLLMKGQSSGK